MHGLTSDEMTILELIDADRAFNERFAYIKELTREEATAIVAFDRETNLPDGSKLYAIRADDGKIIGITNSWASAYWTALSHDFSLLSVH